MRIVVYSYRLSPDEPLPDIDLPDSGRVERHYVDIGGRSQLQQLLQDCSQEAVDYLLVHEFHELGETVEAIGQHLQAFEAMGVRVVATGGAAIPTRTDDPLTLWDCLQQLHRETQRRRLRRGHQQQRLQGRPPPGKAPYGYLRGGDRYRLDRSTAPVVKAFFEHFLLYGSLRGAVRHIAQRYGKRISVTTGRRWLTSAVYRGDLAYKDGRVLPDTHVAILSRAEAAQVDRLLRRNRQLPPRTASAPRSLAGLVSCQTCGCGFTVSRVTRRRQPEEYLYLRPKACPQTPKCPGLSYDEVLQRTVERVCEDLQRLATHLPLPDRDGRKQGLQEQISQKQAVLHQLPQLLDEGILDPETLALRQYHLKAEISQCQSQLAALTPVNLQETAKTVSIPQFWWDLTETERRFYFREFVQQIYIIHSGDRWQVQVDFKFRGC
ncbi:recombinase family protein [Phormidium yuhuli AB48]|uniref:Recombinase family protein n=1 Tax=Phormidium yuhuli AB48 TaxID=2940671 RepID=A0ABY5AVY2_9CYAN|nr:recombinase family protein [Phormidium yuhuli]USR93025.1 recombinase family protein [Phormidium yuhuli AB48]